MDKKKIVVSGAGLVGPMLAISLQKRGHEVHLFEKRSDIRASQADAGRSINLIITAKGLKTIADAGLLKFVTGITTPVRGRMMHSKKGELTFQPYGRDDSEFNHSVSRAELNRLLLSEAENRGVRLYFKEELQKIDFDQKIATFSQSSSVSYDLLFGSDGAGSPTRAQMKSALGTQMSDQTEPLGIEYKELFMPTDKNGEAPIRKDALHIWPRGNHMLMALPNTDGSFTMTLYMPPEDFRSLNTEEKIHSYFEENYADSIPLMPNFLKDFSTNPTGFLGTVRCLPWTYRNEICLIGDAAHAIVPFFGQGMNSGLEDVSYLEKMMEKHGDNWAEIFSEYEQFQKENAEAIADLAIENFRVMSEKVGDEKFLLRRRVEHRLENELPDQYRSRYGMVTYTLIPYQYAKEAGEIQSQILDELCSDIQTEAELDLTRAKTLITEKLTPFLKERNLSLEKYRP